MIGRGSDENKENVNKKGVCENLNNLSVGLCNDQLFLFPRGRNLKVNKRESLSTRRVLKSSCENLNHLIVELCIGGDPPFIPWEAAVSPSEGKKRQITKWLPKK